jgi:hypothetical protein
MAWATHHGRLEIMGWSWGNFHRRVGTARRGLRRTHCPGVARQHKASNRLRRPPARQQAERQGAWRRAAADRSAIVPERRGCPGHERPRTYKPQRVGGSGSCQWPRILGRPPAGRTGSVVQREGCAQQAAHLSGAQAADQPLQGGCGVTLRGSALAVNTTASGPRRVNREACWFA